MPACARSRRRGVKGGEAGSEATNTLAPCKPPRSDNAARGDTRTAAAAAGNRKPGVDWWLAGIAYVAERCYTVRCWLGS